MKKLLYIVTLLCTLISFNNVFGGSSKEDNCIAACKADGCSSSCESKCKDSPHEYDGKCNKS